MAGMLAAGCGEGNSGDKSAKAGLPPDAEIEQVVRSVLPPYAEFRAIESEKIKAEGSSVLVKFKLTASPKEDLFAVTSPGGSMYATLAELLPGKEVKSPARLREDVPKEMVGWNNPYRADVERILADYGKQPQLRKLRNVRASGQDFTLYGKVMAEKMVDKWRFEEVAIEGTMDQLGKPRTSFGVDYLVLNSPEAAKVAQGFLDNQAKLESQLTALVSKYKEESDAKKKADQEAQATKTAAAEQAKKLENERQEQLRRTMLAATSPGKKYLGTFKWMNASTSVVIRFTKQEMDGTILEAELSNPANASESKLYVGRISKEPAAKFPIELQADSDGGIVDRKAHALFKKGGFRFRLTFAFEDGRLKCSNKDMSDLKPIE